jgi:hypothetical protein
MAIAQCDNCGKVRPGCMGEAYGVEGFFCHICRGDELDPYGELEDVCKYPNCDGGPATGYCHIYCRVERL